MLRYWKISNALAFNAEELIVILDAYCLLALSLSKTSLMDVCEISALHSLAVAKIRPAKVF